MSDGTDGLSAFEIARIVARRKGQPVPTVEQWLESLRGERGRDGEPGKPGADGKSIDLAEVEAMVARAFESIPKPRDGRDGLPGAKGDKGEPGTPGADAKPLPQVPWMAPFTRDPETKLTTRVDLIPEPGHGLRKWRMTPARVGGLIESVRIAPTGAST